MEGRGLVRRAERAIRQRYRKYRTEWDLHRRIAGTQPVLVFSLGKVGTTSIHEVLEPALHVPVVHCHQIAHKPGYRVSMLGEEPTTQPYQPPVVWRGDYLRKHMARHPNARWDVVYGVRDPLARHISAMFQLDETYGSLAPEVPVDQKVKWLSDRLRRQFLHGDAGLTWFDDELRAVTGVDVYATPFPSDAGYQAYEQGRFRVLLIRFEDLNRVGPAALSEFFGVEIGEMARANVAADKGYRDLYQVFREQVEMPEEVLDAAYGSRLARHFYTEAELADFRARWARNR